MYEKCVSVGIYALFCYEADFEEVAGEETRKENSYKRIPEEIGEEEPGRRIRNMEG